MTIPAELLAHLLDHYGSCDRDNGIKNDCYHGRNAAGRDDGCLKTGWKGRACPHWKPIESTQLAWLIASHQARASAVTRPSQNSEAK